VLAGAAWEEGSVIPGTKAFERRILGEGDCMRYPSSGLNENGVEL